MASRNESGFTLLETLIAMAIFVLAFASILAVESGAINASERAKKQNIVHMLARNKMIEEEYEFEGRAFDEVAKEKTGAFDEPYSEYKWKAEVKEIEFPNLNFQAMTAQAGGGDASTASAPPDAQNNDQSDMIAKLVSNYLSKAIRQVTVTVTWPKGSGTQSFSLSTYWVDLNHEFQMQN